TIGKYLFDQAEALLRKRLGDVGEDGLAEELRLGAGQRQVAARRERVERHRDELLAAQLDLADEAGHPTRALGVELEALVLPRAKLLERDVTLLGDALEVRRAQPERAQLAIVGGEQDARLVVADLAADLSADRRGQGR